MMDLDIATEMAAEAEKATSSGGRQFTLDDVAMHKAVDDAWIAVAGKVYDITEFIRTHPGMNGVGGSTSTIIAIMNALGSDATQDFTAIHTRSAWNQLEEYCIGCLVESDAGKSGTERPRWSGFDQESVRQLMMENERNAAANRRQEEQVASRKAASLSASMGSDTLSSTLSHVDLTRLEADSSSDDDSDHEITLADLRRHKGVESAWIAVHDNVYDITQLLISGGLGSMAVNMLSLGEDCTQEFAYIPSLSLQRLEGCFVGKLSSRC